MSEQDTGIRGIVSIAYGNASTREIHAVKAGGALLCGTRLSGSPIHAGYLVDRVTCKRCLKKLETLDRISRRREVDESDDEDDDDDYAAHVFVPFFGGGGGAGGFGGGSTGGGGAGR